VSAQDDIREAKAGKAKPKAARVLAGETTIPFKDAVAPSSVNRQTADLWSTVIKRKKRGMTKANTIIAILAKAKRSPPPSSP